MDTEEEEWKAKNWKFAFESWQRKKFQFEHLKQRVHHLEWENEVLRAKVRNYEILYENAEGELLLKGTKKSIFDQNNLIN